jgi:hypothetical protein
MTTVSTTAKINQQTGMVLAYYGYDQSETPPTALKAQLGSDWINIDNSAKPLNSSAQLGADYNVQRNSAGTVENSFSVYINTATKQIAISFKGSDALSNWGSDLWNGGASEFAKIQAQAQAAFDKLATSPDYKDFQFIAIGHSLGGGMAQSFGLKNNLDIQVYNSLPIANETVTNYFGGQAAYEAAIATWKTSGKIQGSKGSETISFLSH